MSADDASYPGRTHLFIAACQEAASASASGDSGRALERAREAQAMLPYPAALNPSDASAVARAASAFSTPSPSSDDFSLRAHFRHLLGDSVGALRELDAWIAIDPKRGATYAVRAEIRWASGYEALARRDIARALEMAPDEPFVICHVAQTLTARSPDPLAVTLLNDLIRRYPKEPIYLATRAAAHESLDNHSAALLDLDTSLILEPHNQFAREARARLRVIEHDHAGVIEDIGATDPEQLSSRSLLDRAQCLQHTDDHDGALADLNIVIEREGVGNLAATAHLFATRSTLVLRRFDDTIAHAAAALDGGLKGHAATLARGARCNAHLATERRGEAFDDALAMFGCEGADDFDISPTTLLHWIDRMLGDDRIEEALRMAHALVTKCPDAEDPRVMLGIVLMLSGEHDEAIACAETACATSEHGPAAHFLLAFAYGLIRDTDQAERESDAFDARGGAMAPQMLGTPLGNAFLLMVAETPAANARGAS